MPASEIRITLFKHLFSEYVEIVYQIVFNIHVTPDNCSGCDVYSTRYNISESLREHIRYFKTVDKRSPLLLAI